MVSIFFSYFQLSTNHILVVNYHAYNNCENQYAIQKVKIFVKKYNFIFIQQYFAWALKFVINNDFNKIS